MSNTIFDISNSDKMFECKYDFDLSNNLTKKKIKSMKGNYIRTDSQTFLPMISKVQQVDNFSQVEFLDG